VGGVGGAVIVSPVETDRYGRTVAEVFVKVQNSAQAGAELLVNYEMVRSGMAYHYRRYSGTCPNGGSFDRAETEVKGQRVGVWTKDNEKPGEFRKGLR
jgi:micrococcal nuclease